MLSDRHIKNPIHDGEGKSSDGNHDDGNDGNSNDADGNDGDATVMLMAMMVMRR